MKKLVIATLVTLSAIAVTPARADRRDVVGGLIAGVVLAEVIEHNQPQNYYPVYTPAPAPVYYPAPVYSSGPPPVYVQPYGNLAYERMQDRQYEMQRRYQQHEMNEYRRGAEYYGRHF